MKEKNKKNNFIIAVVVQSWKNCKTYVEEDKTGGGRVCLLDKGNSGWKACLSSELRIQLLPEKEKKRKEKSQRKEKKSRGQ